MEHAGFPAGLAGFFKDKFAQVSENDPDRKTSQKAF